MEKFYIKFYDIIFEIYAGRQLFENSFCELLDNESQVLPDYIIKFCGTKELNCIEKMCKGDVIANYKGNKYYTYKMNERETLKINIDSPCGAHMIICRDNQFDIYNIGEEKNEKWAVRVCQDIILIEMLKKGFVPIHASAVRYKNKGIIIFGNKRDGKSTTMFSLVEQEQACDIISNDLVFIGKNKNCEWILIGWPWKVTIGNTLLNKTQYRYLINCEREKTQFYPLQFCETFNSKWAWQAKLGLIIHPHLIIGQKLEISNLKKENAKKVLRKKGIEYETIFNVFTGEQIIPQFNEIFDILVRDYIIHEINGDIWEHKAELASFIDATL